ncbi:MAG: UDP-glucose 4-epimerase GalE [Bryobacteraceae bacterium]
MEIPVLVAGGAGYIGSHTAKVLRQAGMLPVTVDNLATGNRWAVRFGPFAEGSIANRAFIRDVAREHGVRGAILFAAHAYVGESTEDPAKYYRNNVSGSIEFLDGLLDAGVKSLVFSSSCAIYGIQKEIPIHEDSPKNPLSPYAETKLFLENALGWYGQAYGLRSVCLRYFNAAGADPEGEVGEWHDPETHLIPLTIGAAMGGGALRIFGADYPTPDGTAIRDYIHVTDLADAHVRALRHLLGGGDSASLNCGTGTGHSVKQVVEAVEAVSGRRVPVEYAPRRQGDAPALVADARRIRETLGWEPRYSSIETIAATAWRWRSTFLESRLAEQAARVLRG